MKRKATLSSLFLIANLTACSNLSHTEQNLIGGAILGTISGIAVASVSGKATEGALIGAGLGAIGGYLFDRKYHYQNDF